jgi:predicted DsbA family dithiol-disulfide isomerase
MIIDIVSDAVCPWCYIGKRRLEKALQMAPQPDLQIGWRPFQLNPELPPEGIDRQAYIEAKFGTRDRAAAHRRVAAIGESVGIPFAFDLIKRTPNTILAHRLIRYAARENLQDAVVETLFRGYFIEGQDIGDAQALAELAASAGLDADKVAAYLAGNEDEETIRSEDAFARQIGISGVPCFIIDRQYAISGAQEPAAFLEIFKLAKENAGKEAAELS